MSMRKLTKQGRAALRARLQEKPETRLEPEVEPDWTRTGRRGGYCHVSGVESAFIGDAEDWNWGTDSRVAVVRIGNVRGAFGRVRRMGATLRRELEQGKTPYEIFGVKA